MTWTVVSIDDIEEVGELVRVMLRHQDITVHHVRDGPSGLALIHEVLPDLVMLDVMLPGMSGWEVHAAIRADEKLRTLPIIMLSVLTAKPEQLLRFENSDIDLYVTKPFDARRLRKQVAQMLGVDLLWPVTARCASRRIARTLSARACVDDMRSWRAVFCV